MATRPEVPGSGRDLGDRGGGGLLERRFALISGVSLIVLGLAGFVGDPIVGRPDRTSLFVTGPGHDVLHLMAGALYVHVAIVLRGRQRTVGLVVLGASLLVTGALSLLTPDLLGLYGAPASGLDQLGHLGLGGLSVLVAQLTAGGRREGLARRAARVSRAPRRRP